MGKFVGDFAHIEPIVPPVDVTNYPSEIVFDADGNVVVAVLGATNPPDNAGQVLRYALVDGSVAGVLLDTLVDQYPPLSSIAWIRSPGSVPGDFNGDGVVNAADYDKWRADFGKWVAKGGGADGSGNGMVDAADYAVWRKAFDAGVSLAGAATIPEPASMLMIIWGTCCGLSRRIQRRV
jgi:hypothetical protein